NMRVLERKREGFVIPLVAVSLTIIVGLVAIAIDGGLLLERRQRVQGTADAAALAAANDLFVNWQSNKGLDPDDSAKKAAVAVATANGFPDITVNIPPKSGPFTGQAGYAEVIVNYNQRRSFSTLFGSTDVPVHARAVAQGRWAAVKVGVMVLNPTMPGSLNVTGGGTMTVAGVPIIIDSNAPNAGTSSGG